MKKFSILIIIVTCTLVTYAQAPNWKWAKNAGTSGYRAGTYSTTTDASGNVIAVGTFDSPTITFGSTTIINTSDHSIDMFIVKYDSNGNVIWAKSAGGTGATNFNQPDTTVALSVATDNSGNIFVTGYFDADTIIFDSILLINTAADNNLPYYPWAIKHDIFLVKYNTNGNVVWARGADGNKNDEANSVVVDAFGNSYITGTYKDTIIFDATVLTSPNNDKCFFVKFDVNGNAIWAKNRGGQSVDVDATGNVFVAGPVGDTLINSIDYLAKLDAIGNVIWEKSIQSLYCTIKSISVNTTGDILVTGSFSGSTIGFDSIVLTNTSLGGSSDMFLAKFDNNGNVLWAKNEVGINNEMGISLATDMYGKVFVSGIFNDASFNIGSTTLTFLAGNNNNTFIACYDDLGNALWAKNDANDYYSDLIYNYVAPISVDTQGDLFYGAIIDNTSLVLDTITLSKSGYTDMLIAKLTIPSCSVSFQSTATPCSYTNFLTTSIIPDTTDYPINYTWNFGDGNSATTNLDTISHIYIAPGFTACVTMQTANGCTSTFCDSVAFSLPPNPDAGPDQTVCGIFANLCAIPTVPGGTWSCPQGGIAYYDSINGNYNINYKDSACTTIRFASPNEMVTMYWYENIGVCTGYDSVNIYFASIQAAISLVDPADSLVCGPNYTLLNALQPAFGSGYWYDVMQNTIFSPSPSNLSPTATILPTNYGYHTFFWVTVNGNCRDTSEAVYVKFIETPVSNAGGNYWPELFGANSHIKTDTVCGLSYQMSAIPLSGNGHWYSLDSTNTHFGNISGPNITSIPTDSVYLGCTGCYSVFNPVQKYKEFIWQETSNGCVSTDTLRLYFAPNPSGQFTIEQPVCSQNNFIVIAHTWPLPNDIDYSVTGFNWSFPNGVMDSLIVNLNVSDTVLISWPAGNQNNVTLTTINTWGCSSPLISHLLNAPFFASLSPNSPTTIGGNDGYIETNVTGGTPPYVYSWNTGQTTANIYNLTSGSYSLNITDAYSCNFSYSVQLFEPYDTTGGPIVDTLTTSIIDSCLNFVPDSFYISNFVIDSINNIATITWTFTNGGLTSSITAQYTYYYSGNNAVMLTLNCGAKTLVTYMSYVNIIASVGITDNIAEKLEITVYPVPFNDRLNIVFNSKKSGNVNLNVIDVTGRSIMMKQASVSSGDNTIELNTSDYHSGIYILNIESDGKVYHKQIVK